MAEEIVNKVAQSQLQQVDLDDYYYSGPILSYDIAQNLFQELVLREKDFRAFLTKHPWENYAKQYVSVVCSVDAIIPNWAYMLIASHLEKVGAIAYFGSQASFREKLLLDQMTQLDLAVFKDKPVLIKGCGKADISPQVYIQFVQLIQPIAKSIMFGEACSTVPVYKKKA